MTTELIVVPQQLASVAGALIWWELSGHVDHLDLADEWAARGLDPKLLPEPPRLDTALARAAGAAMPSNVRMLLRPLKRRGAWEVVKESVVEGDEATGRTEHLKHDFEIQGWIRTETGGAQVPELNPTTHPLAPAILSGFDIFQKVLATDDVSAWLLNVLLRNQQTVSLRRRGGFYLVPADKVESWRNMSAAVAACSNHTFSELPVMRTDEAVAEILRALRKEAVEAMVEMETYLKGDVSTKGLNAAEINAGLVLGKVKHYADLLGVDLPDLIGRAEQITGAVTAARLARKEAK